MAVMIYFVSYFLHILAHKKEEKSSIFTIFTQEKGHDYLHRIRNFKLPIHQLRASALQRIAQPYVLGNFHYFNRGKNAPYQWGKLRFNRRNGLFFAAA